MGNEQYYSKMYNWVARAKDLNSFDKLLLTRLQGHKGKQDYAWPSVRLLAEELGAHKSQVQRGLGRLEALKYIVVVRRNCKSGGKKANHYYFNEPKNSAVNTESYTEGGNSVGTPVPIVSLPVPISPILCTYSRYILYKEENKEENNRKEQNLSASQSEADTSESTGITNLANSAGNREKKIEDLEADFGNNNSGEEVRNSAPMPRRVKPSPMAKVMKRSAPSKILESVWVSSMSLVCPDLPSTAYSWTAREFAMANQLLDILPAEQASLLIKYTVENWGTIRAASKQKVYSLTPSMPFILSQRTELLKQAMVVPKLLESKRLYEAWLSLNKGTFTPAPPDLINAYTAAIGALKGLGLDTAA